MFSKQSLISTPHTLTEGVRDFLESVAEAGAGVASLLLSAPVLPAKVATSIGLSLPNGFCKSLLKNFKLSTNHIFTKEKVAWNNKMT